MATDITALQQGGDTITSITAKQGGAIRSKDGNCYSSVGGTIYLGKNEDPADFENITECELIVHNIQGSENEMDNYWNEFCMGGKRETYDYAFCNYGSETLEPIFPILAKRISYMFMNCKNLLDASNIEIVCDSENPNLMGFCMSCEKMAKPPKITFTEADFIRTWTSAFAGCTALTECEIDFGDFPADDKAAMRAASSEIANSGYEEFYVKNRNTMQNTFFGCSALENVTFKGVGSPKNLDFSASSVLSLETLAPILQDGAYSSSQSEKSLLFCLADVSSASKGDYSVKVSTATYAEIESYDENMDKADKIIDRFSEKGWTITV